MWAKDIGTNVYYESGNRDWFANLQIIKAIINQIKCNITLNYKYTAYHLLHRINTTVLIGNSDLQAVEISDEKFDKVTDADKLFSEYKSEYFVKIIVKRDYGYNYLQYAKKYLI